MNCDKCGSPVRTYASPRKGGPLQVECMACGCPPKACMCKDRMRLSARVSQLIARMGLEGAARDRVNRIYAFKANLGEYEDFLPELKGKRYRKALYETIEEDLSRYIWHHDMGQAEEMPEGFRP